MHDPLVVPSWRRVLSLYSHGQRAPVGTERDRQYASGKTAERDNLAGSGEPQRHLPGIQAHHVSNRENSSTRMERHATHIFLIGEDDRGLRRAEVPQPGCDVTTARDRATVGV